LRKKSCCQNSKYLLDGGWYGDGLFPQGKKESHPEVEIPSQGGHEDVDAITDDALE
jgi:hypothetical protein